MVLWKGRVGMRVRRDCEVSITMRHEMLERCMRLLMDFVTAVCMVSNTCPYTLYMTKSSYKFAVKQLDKRDR